MSDFLRLLAVFFAAINPASALLVAAGLRFRDRRERRTAVAIAAVLAGALVAAAAFAADQLLDALEIEPETFRIAAGIVMATTGIYATLRPGPAVPPGEGGRAAGLFPLGIPTLLTPAALAAAISYGADEGPGRTIGAALIVLAVAAGALFVLPTGRWKAPADGLARLTGALLVVLGVALIVDGVQAV